VTAPAFLAILALLVPGAGPRLPQRGWFVRLGADAWTYSPAEADATLARTRPATFLHLADDGTAIQLAVAVTEDTSSRAGSPALSDAGGFVVWSGTWRRTSDGEVEIDVALRLSTEIGGQTPLSSKYAATVHGRHLLTADGPFLPLGFAYPVDSTGLRKQLFEFCCSVPGRDPACRAVRR
jgi:hypothetical protein